MKNGGLPIRITGLLIGLLLLLATASIAAGGVPTPTAPPGITALAIESDPSDYLGRGQRLLLMDADGTFTVSHSLGFVSIDFASFEDSSKYWQLVFVAPRGEELLPKAYESVSSFPSPRQPGIDIAGEHRFCSTLVGRFVVLEAVYGPDEVVEQLAIDFEVRCSNRDSVFSGAIRIRSAAPLPAARTPTPTPRPDDFVLWVYDEGDPLGSTMLTAQTNPHYIGQFFGATRKYVAVDSDPDATWRIEFSSGQCSRLVPGIYDNAVLYPTSGAAAPQLRIQFRLRYGCDLGYDGGEGRFIVHEAQFGEFGEIYRFVAEFEQNCINSPLGFRGGVRFISRRPTPAPRSPTPTPTDYSSMAVMYSDRGDYIGSCNTHILTLANGDFSATYSKNAIHIVFEGGPNSWLFEFEAPGDGPLLPGYYPNARRWPFQDETEPGLNVAGQTKGCNKLFGEFTVHEADIAEDGTVRQFAADFVQYCEGSKASGPKLYGTVRFRSSLPPPTLNPTHTPTPTPEPIACPGDCDRDGHATVDEIINIVNLALGSRQVGSCSSADLSRDFRITVDEITQAVRDVLSDCATVR